MSLPENIGKFRVQRLLGQGAMGRVFLAEDELIDRQVAVKMMTSEGDDEARERFRNEARIVGQLSHPNIVHLHEFGFHQGQPYLVMEYLVGESLDLWLARPQPLKAKLAVLLDLCQAIGHAHSRGVLHRDIKPSNLQVLPDGTCKLMDFGIARSRAVHLTATGMILGTPEFIAPEVLQDAGYSTRSDLFAVGLVVYQTLAGSNPFHAGTLEGCLTRVLTHEPPPLAEVCTDVSVELSDEVSKALRKTPEDRPADVSNLMAALRGLQDRTLRLDRAPSLETPLSMGDTPSVDTSSPRDFVSSKDAISTLDIASRAQSMSEGPTIRTQTRVGGQRHRLSTLVALLATFLAAATATVIWRPWSGTEPAGGAVPVSATGVDPAANRPGLPVAPPAVDPASGTALADDLPASPPADDRRRSEPGPREDVSSHTEVAGPARPEVAVPTKSRAGEVARHELAKTAETVQEVQEPADPRGAESELLSNVQGADVGEPVEGMEKDQGEPAEVLPGKTETPGARSPDSSPPAPSPPMVQSTTGEEPVAEPIADQGSAGEPASEIAGAPVLGPALRIDGLEPLVVRRGSTTSVRIVGEGIGPETEVVIRRGGRPVRRMRILRSKSDGASKLNFTLLVDRQLPLGTYSVFLVDGGGKESNSVALEVGL